METLFDVKHATISEHIKNIFKEGELDEKTSVGISDKSSGGRKSKIYNLDIIISVGYRVKSKICVQCMHNGSYDDEPTTVDLICTNMLKKMGMN